MCTWTKLTTLHPPRRRQNQNPPESATRPPLLRHATSARDTLKMVCVIVLTGFGPFAGVTENPTEWLAVEIAKAARAEGDDGGGVWRLPHGAHLRTVMLEVSTADVDAKLKQLHAEPLGASSSALVSADGGDGATTNGESSSSPSTMGEPAIIDSVIFVHLGVDAKVGAPRCGRRRARTVPTDIGAARR